MRLSGLAVAVILLLSFAAFSQHSSSSGGGSSGSGGGSHSSSSGGGSSGGSSHSSGGGGSLHSSSSGGSSHSSSSTSGHSGSGGHSGSSSHTGGGSSAHSVNMHGAGSGPSHAGTPRSNAIHADGIGSDASRSTEKFRSPVQTPAPQKRSFFSFLRHPFPRPRPKPEPTPVPEPARKPVADLRHPVCLRGPCLACPMGQVPGASGCVSGFTSHADHFCSSAEIWSGGACVQQLHFLDDCTYLRMSMARQQQSMQAAANERQTACVAAQSQACSEATTKLNTEESLYRSFRNQYLRCQSLNMFPGRYSYYPRSSFGLMFDSVGADWTFSDIADFQF